jgi:hypothetical protein
VHYPENVDLETAKGQSRMVLGEQGINIHADAEFRPINPTLIYNYSSRPESRYNNIGYVDQGTSRVLSTAPTYPHYYLHSQYPYDQHINSQTYFEDPNPGVRLTDPRGAAREEISPSAGSYISGLDNYGGGREEVKRPFDNIAKSGSRVGISQVRNQSSLNRYDDYGPSLVVQ